MIDTVCATKKGMSQVWDTRGKRIAITKFLVEPNLVVGAVAAQVQNNKKEATSWEEVRIVEIGYGSKKLKQMAKPLRCRLQKHALEQGIRKIVGIRELKEGAIFNVGQTVPVAEILKVGTFVQVQGTTKGRGFAGVVKRYHFHGGPKTHGQSDRWRATGSIGNRTTPGRVWLGKRMPGHYGVATQTVRGLTIVHFDADKKELWLSGPVPGAFNSIVTIKCTGKMNPKLVLAPATSPEPAPKAGSVSQDSINSKPITEPKVAATSAAAPAEPEETKNQEVKS